MQAEGQNKRSQPVHPSEQKESESKTLTENYKLQLNAKQAALLTNYLPKGYSLQFQSKIQKRSATNAGSKQQRTTMTKKKSVDSKLLNQNEQGSSELNRLPAMRSKKSINMKYNDQVSDIGYAKYTPVYPPPQLSRRNTYQGLDQSLKPCVKILNLLKNSKTSWPFRQPVDPIALGIPHYTQIIKEPMDLSKIQHNLRTGQYATPTQFHADLGKIIRNSYTFNKGNIDFTKITEEFEQYYFKIIADPNLDQKVATAYVQPAKAPKPAIQPNIASQIKKKKPEKPYSADNPISLAQKKELSINIRKLPRQHMKGIVDIVRQQGDSKIKDQFDLEDLRPQTIRQLQNYVRSKLMQPTQRFGQSKSNDNKEGNEQSEFQIESQEDS